MDLRTKGGFKLDRVERRLSNKVTLLAIASWLYSVLELYGVINLLPTNFWEIVVLGGINLLVVLGIVNNPDKVNKGLSDDQ